MGEISQRMALSVLRPFVLPAAAGEWPCYMGDSARSGVIQGEFEFPLSADLMYRPAQVPQPAWPEFGREREVEKTADPSGMTSNWAAHQQRRRP